MVKWLGDMYHFITVIVRADDVIFALIQKDGVLVAVEV